MTPFISIPLGEDWSSYLHLGVFGWFMFLLFGFVRLAGI